MRNRWFRLPTRAVASALVIFLFGCAAVPPEPPAATKSASILSDEEVFSAGFNSISEKYIEPVSVESIAYNGLQGFAAIDPALSVQRTDTDIVLALDGRPVAKQPAPGAASPRAWAKLTAEYADMARRHSDLMRRASAEKLYEAVFDGVLSDLDVFSRYAGAEEARRNRARREGFGGIGIRFKLKDGKPTVTEVMPETPAANVDLRAGDVITHIDGTPLEKPQTGDIVRQLRGPINSEVRVRIMRPSENRHIDVVMERQHIVPPSVTATISDDILMLKISGFNQATARSMAKELRKATSGESDLKGLVIDLRGNPGGLLKQSVKVADLLLTQGNILHTRGRHPDSFHNYEAGGRDLAGGLPVAVLVDGKSASASEIVAAALQDRERAVLIGTASFGKGTVQTVIRLPNDGEITLTWSRLVAPSGYTLHGLGVRPGICTSDTATDVEELVLSATAKRHDVRRTYSNWRTAGPHDKSLHKRLRNTCPSARHKSDLEYNVARMLIKDQKLYAQALELSSGTVEARK